MARTTKAAPKGFQPAPYQSFWDSMVQTVSPVPQRLANAMGRIFRGGPTIANTWPDYEVTTPQYPTPSPFALAQLGYRKNEVVYACIDKRVVSLTEAPAKLWDDKSTNKARESLDEHPVRMLLEQPNEAMSEVDFWAATEIYTLTAGFAIWEIEFDNAGQPIHLWPMRPDWCSTRRGHNRPLEYVRYQPWGLPPQDVPVENLLVFMEFDPVFPMLKGLSKTALGMRTLTVDNAATDFLASFFQRGAVVGGLLSTEQNLQDAEAERIRARWRLQHGGTENWGDIAVLGNGAKYQPLSMTFREMDFSSIDGRAEARACMLFGVPPILINAQVGLRAMTYSNYEQSRKAFYEGTISPRWRWYQSKLTRQLLPHFKTPKPYVIEFDTSGVAGLQENKDALWRRLGDAANRNLITRDEWRSGAGYDQIDDGAPVFIGVSVRAMNATDIAPGGPGELGPQSEQAALMADTGSAPDLATLQQLAEAGKQGIPIPPTPPGAQAPANAAKPQAGGQAAGGQAAGGQAKEPPTPEKPAEAEAKPTEEKPKPKAKPTKAMQTEAMKRWRSEALAALREGHMILVDPTGNDIDAKTAAAISVDLIGCKTASEVRQVFETHWPHDEETLAESKEVGENSGNQSPAPDLLQALVEEVRAARKALEVEAKFNQHHGEHGRFASSDESGSTGLRESAGHELLKLLRTKGGFTYQPIYQNAPKDGFMVSPYGDRELVVKASKLSQRDMLDYIVKNADLLRQPDHFIGGWVNKADGKAYLDISVRRGSKKEALDLGRKHNQIAIFDLGKMQEIKVPGTVEARHE